MSTTRTEPTFLHGPGTTMRHMLRAACAIALCFAGWSQAQPYVNVTVGGAVAPGVYGEIAIGNNPVPPVINAQPVIMAPAVPAAAPLYLYVPTEYRADWGHYCRRYDACGRPVYFVEIDERDRWWQYRREREYNKEYRRHRDHDDDDDDED